MMFSRIVCLICCLLPSYLLAASHNPQQILKNIRGSKQEGAQIVQQFCATCHASKPLVELGAPKIRVESDWKPRLRAGFDSLLKHTEDGYGAMPPRGGCFECSDAQLRLAIEAMLPKTTHRVYK